MPYESKCDRRLYQLRAVCQCLSGGLPDEHVSEAYHQPTPEQEDATQEAADGCPVSVIEIE